MTIRVHFEAELYVPSGHLHALPRDACYRPITKPRDDAEGACRSALALSRAHGLVVEVSMVEVGPNIHLSTTIAKTFRDPITDRWTIHIASPKGSYFL